GLARKHPRRPLLGRPARRRDQVRPPPGGADRFAGRAALDQPRARGHGPRPRPVRRLNGARIDGARVGAQTSLRLVGDSNGSGRLRGQDPSARPAGARPARRGDHDYQAWAAGRPPRSRETDNRRAPARCDRADQGIAQGPDARGAGKGSDRRRTAVTDFVLDSSVTFAWFFEDERSEATDRLLDRLENETAAVPALWYFEVANVLAIGERRRRTTSV